MMEISKNWQQLKNILLFNNLYFDYEDSEDGKSRMITVQRNAAITYVCGMQIVENPAQDSDQYDFEQNWAAKAGEKKYVYYSQRFDVTLDNGSFQYDFKIKQNDESTDAEAFLYKGVVDVGTGAVRGDSIEISVVDKDNILGFGEDVTVGYIFRKKILSGGAQIISINPPKYDFLSSKRKILSGLYIRVKYTGSGQPNIITDYEYEY